MMTRVRIDLNVRVRGSGTYAGLEDVDGPIDLGDVVTVFEPESSFEGYGHVTDIDLDARLVYLAVDWASLRRQGGPARPVDVLIAGHHVSSASSQRPAVAGRPGSLGLQQQVALSPAVASRA